MMYSEEQKSLNCILRQHSNLQLLLGEEVFKWLQDTNLMMKLKNCIFGAEECVYLGYRTGKREVRSEQNTVQAILEMKQPQTKKDVRIFLPIVDVLSETMLPSQNH